MLKSVCIRNSKIYCNAMSVFSLGPCRFVTCAWNPWGDWSATCGRITRQRTSKVTHHLVYRPNCVGLQTTCPAPQTQSTFVSCESIAFSFYNYINLWATWSSNTCAAFAVWVWSMFQSCSSHHWLELSSLSYLATSFCKQQNESRAGHWLRDFSSVVSNSIHNAL